MSAALPPFQRFLDAQREHVWRFLVASVGEAEAEDCFQETFLAALRAYPRLHPDSNLRAWVLTIAHHKAMDAHRARARGPVPVAAMSEKTGGTPASEDVESASPDLWAAVGHLPSRQRTALVLRYAGDLSHREVAGALGCSEEAARRCAHEGLKTLREVWTR